VPQLRLTLHELLLLRQFPQDMLWRRWSLCCGRIAVAGRRSGRLEVPIRLRMMPVPEVPSCCTQHAMPKAPQHTVNAAPTFACDLRRLAFCTRFFTCTQRGKLPPSLPAACALSRFIMRIRSGHTVGSPFAQSYRRVM
jgi:hypothetical protein